MKLEVGQVIEWIPDKYIAQAEIKCSTGTLINIRLKYPGTPMEQKRYTIRFKEGVFVNPLFSQVYELTVAEKSISIK